jgi:hypothetical protein
MIDRRAALRVALALPAAWLAMASPGDAQEFQKFTPFLVDLPGWTGNKPDGMAMQMPGATMITASREYRRGEAKVNAHIFTGPPAQGAIAVIQSGVKLETAEMHMSTETIDGLTLARTFQIKDQSGTVIVALGPSAAFTFEFHRLPEDEGLALARRFDWKAIQAAVPK